MRPAEANPNCLRAYRTLPSKCCGLRFSVLAKTCSRTSFRVSVVFFASVCFYQVFYDFVRAPVSLCAPLLCHSDFFCDGGPFVAAINAVFGFGPELIP